MSILFTKQPDGWPLMKDAFLSFVSYAIGQDKFHIQFKKDSGHDLKSLIPNNILDSMIDESTGRTKDILRDFMGWLIVNHWGEAKPEPEIPTIE